MSQKVKISQQSRYAPIRYEATRPYAIRVGRFAASADHLGAEEHGAFIFKQLFPLVKLSVEQLGKPDGPGPVQAENTNIQIFGGYLRGGRVIFDVRNELAKSLLVTDAHDVPCGALELPMESFYLHFGPGTDLCENGMDVEGVYVRRMAAEGGDRLLVDIVPAGHFAVRAFWQLPMGEAMTGISIALRNADEPILEALDHAIDETIERNRAILDQYREMEQQLSAKYGQIVKIPSPIEDLADKRDLLRRAMQLTVNTLFFLAAEPDDVREDWDHDAPEDLVRQTSAAQFGARKTAENTLASRGYMKIRYVGARYAESADAKALVAAMGTRTVTTHLRRGHFRAQPYGPERALRKTVFIAPVVVNAGKGEPTGRIYEV